MVENTPKGWTIERVQAYFLWSRAVVRAIRIDTIVASELKRKLESIFSSDFIIEGQRLPCIPPGSEEILLQNYYKSLDLRKK